MCLVYQSVALIGSCRCLCEADGWLVGWSHGSQDLRRHCNGLMLRRLFRFLVQGPGGRRHGHTPRLEGGGVVAVVGPSGWQLVPGGGVPVEAAERAAIVPAGGIGREREGTP